MVNALIDGATRKWNVQGLHDIFVPGDVELILSKQHVINQSVFYS